MKVKVENIFKNALIFKEKTLQIFELYSAYRPFAHSQNIITFYNTQYK